MQLNWSISRSKLARRIFVMFVACTLLPIAALFIISFNQVSRQLDLQGQKRLKRAVKVHGAMVYERLSYLETDLKIIGSMLLNQADVELNAEHLERLRQRFVNVQLVPLEGPSRSILGKPFAPPEMTTKQRSHIRSGKTLLHEISDGGGRWPQLTMTLLVQPTGRPPAILMADIAPQFLWTNWDQNVLPSDLDFCVLDHRGKVIFSTLNLSAALAREILRASTLQQHQPIAVDVGGEKFQISHWILFLKPNFLIPQWTVTVIQPHSTVMWPMAQFRYLFILTTAMTFFVVLLLSINMIRRSLTPLERLKESTRRIARKDFTGRLDIRSGDEFEELAEAFNNMSDQLNRQFNTLVAKSEIDRAILSSIETEKIVQAVLTGMRSCFSYDAVSIVLLDNEGHQPAQIYTGSGSRDGRIETSRSRLTKVDLELFSEHPDYICLRSDHALPACLQPMAASRCATYLVLPIFLKEELAAIIAIGSHETRPRSQEDIRLARQMADQVAVALSNSKLMNELNRLNWGTIKALARAVDAKSSWTAGHSDRVAAMAVSIGNAMHLPSGELEDLKRAALLHDIGKLGVPAAVLDKPGELTAAEYRTIQRHPALGARILQPINAYTAIIPMVRHHHENFDGSGYPDGIAGNDIELGARILAVADVFDALKSDRPYRRGMPLTQVMDIMRGEAMRQFDPQVIEVFEDQMAHQAAGVRPDPLKTGSAAGAARFRRAKEVFANGSSFPASTP